MPKLEEGVDFYMEDGLMVLTERFLRKRGYCCGSGCRHCPYGGPAGEHKAARPKENGNERRQQKSTAHPK